MTGYVVVLFSGAGADGWCSLSRCPLGTAEWFSTREEAAAYCESVPSGFEPHILTVSTEVSTSERPVGG